MRFNKWPFRRFSLSQLFHRYSQQFQQKLCLPADEWWRDEHTLQSASCRAKCTLCSPPSSSLPGVHSGALRSAECALHGSLSGCSGRPRVRRSSQLGLVWVRLQRDGASGRKDHRPITFSKKRWANLPPGHQCPHTCRPRLLDLPKVLGSSGCRLLGGQTAVGCLRFGDWGPRWWAGGSRWLVHTLLSRTTGVTHHSTGGGRGEKRGRGRSFKTPRWTQVSQESFVPCL